MSQQQHLDPDLVMLIINATGHRTIDHFAAVLVKSISDFHQIGVMRSGEDQLGITGVKTLEDFKRLTVAGVGRIVLSNAWELYVEWMREVENITLDTTNVVKAQTSNKETSAMAQKLQNFPRLAEVSSATEKKMGQAGTSRV